MGRTGSARRALWLWSSGRGAVPSAPIPWDGSGVGQGEQNALQESREGEAEDQNEEFATEDDGVDGELRGGAI